MLAVLVASLAPVVSHALGKSGTASWVEVCTAQGSQWVQGDAPPAGDPAPGAGHLLDHCPYCSLHPNAVGIPPALLQALPPVAAGHAVPLAFLAAPRTLHAWVSAQPRAPPLSSC